MIMKHLYLRCIAGISLLCACTKTETVPYEAAATNLMLEYKIVNVQGDPIYGAIQHNDTTISLYLPFYRQLATLEPQIKVSAGIFFQYQYQRPDDGRFQYLQVPGPAGSYC